MITLDRTRLIVPLFDGIPSPPYLILPIRMEKNSYERIYDVVRRIPKGTVATYGQIARLIGRERNARLVGKVLSMSEYYGDYPCHRVVNHRGRLAPFFFEQGTRLLEEGVQLLSNGYVDMKKYQWIP